MNQLTACFFSMLEEDLLPSHIQAPAGPLQCNCTDHLEKMEYEMDLPVPAKKLYDMLFSEDAGPQGLWQQKTNASGSRGQWEKHPSLKRMETLILFPFP